MYKLYGDGIHDDVCAIQEMLDSGLFKNFSLLFFKINGV